MVLLSQCDKLILMRLPFLFTGQQSWQMPLSWETKTVAGPVIPLKRNYGEEPPLLSSLSPVTHQDLQTTARVLVPTAQYVFILEQECEKNLSS